MVEWIKKTNDYVSLLLENELNVDFTYHNFLHTQRVLKSTKEIINNTSFSQEEELILTLSALLHDIGYAKSKEDHEEVGALMAIDFLSKEGVDKKIINQIAQIIRATRIGVSPINELEKTLCDADSSHFGKDYFKETSEYLRQELYLINNIDYSVDQWRECNIEMFTHQHQYYTEYAIKNWKPVKDKHLSDMINEQKDFKKEKKKTKNKLKEESPEKGVQSMFRITLRNHIKLSDIADTKANILLSVNAIIVSLALSNLIPKLDNPNNGYLILPTIIFITFSIVSMILSVLATRPNITSGKFTREDVNEKKVNLLFFGNFHKMSLTEFEWAINEMMKDKEYIYSSLTKDLYFLGLVLNRKYRILRVTYTVFIIGIVATAIAFALCFKMQETETVVYNTINFISLALS